MKTKYLPVVVATLTLLIIVAACSSPDETPLPPIPEIELDNMSAEIRAQVGQGLADLRENESDPDANGHVGMLLDAYDRIEEAAIFYRRARHLDPDNFRWTYLTGMALMRIGENSAAIKALENALTQRPGYPSAELALAGLLYSQQEIDRSIERYEELIQRNPAFARAHFEYGKLLYERGDMAAAIESLETALRYSNRYGQAHYTLSQAYRDSGADERAALHLKLFERYRLFGPGPNDPIRDRISALNIADASKEERALLLSAQGNQPEAARLLEELAAKGSVSAHINLIAVYGEMGEYDRARQHADTAMALDPESVELYDNIGVLLLKQNRYEEAKTAFRTAIDLDPENSVPYKNLGIALEVTRDTEEAITNHRRAVALDPFDRQARFFLARALLDNDQADQAIDAVEVITRFPQPESAQYWHLLGRAYQRMQDYQKAVDAFQQAVIAAQNRRDAELARKATVQLKRTRRMMQR